MKKTTIGTLLALCAAAGLSACNGSSNNATAPPGTGTNCGGPPSSNQLQVLFPIPNSKNAPPILGNIYVSTKGPLPPSNSFNFFLVQANGNSQYTSSFFVINASKVPTPHATPGYPNPTYYASSLNPSAPPLGPDQAVSVYWNDGGTGCTPHVMVSSFRTKK